LHATLLCRHSRPGRTPRGARGPTRRRACAAGAGEQLMKNLLRIVAVGMAVFLTGCASIGPDYHPAKIVAPQLQGLDPAQENHAAFQAAWWKQFNDPTLDALIQHAAANNLDLRIA